MELLVKGKNMEVTEEMRGYILRRLGKLERRLPNISNAEVELTYERSKSSESRYAVQVTIEHQGTLLRGEERADTLFTAIDAVTDVINRQVERYKGKLYGRKKRASTRKEGLAVGQEEPGKVVRLKSFPAKPMSADEAIDQMELLGHDFFIFFNKDVSQFNVVYRRRDGDYGLIQPELG
jgi:putative sigma-54 modulation protein